MAEVRVSTVRYERCSACRHCQCLWERDRYPDSGRGNAVLICCWCNRAYERLRHEEVEIEDR